MIRASGADDDDAPYPRLLFGKLRFLVIVDTELEANRSQNWKQLRME